MSACGVGVRADIETTADRVANRAKVIPHQPRFSGILKGPCGLFERLLPFRDRCLLKMTRAEKTFLFLSLWRRALWLARALLACLDQRADYSSNSTFRSFGSSASQPDPLAHLAVIRPTSESAQTRVRHRRPGATARRRQAGDL